MSDQNRSTAEKLAVALETLRQIAETPRNVGARRNARATLAFLETQPAEPPKKPRIATKEENRARMASDQPRVDTGNPARDAMANNRGIHTNS